MSGYEVRTCSLNHPVWYDADAAFLSRMAGEAYWPLCSWCSLAADERLPSELGYQIDDTWSNNHHWRGAGRSVLW